MSGQDIMGDAQVLSHFSLLRKFLTKTGWCAGALLWRRNQQLFLHLLGHFLLTASARRRKISMYISLLTAGIPVNYTGQFRGLFEATYLARLVIFLESFAWRRRYYVSSKRRYLLKLAATQRNIPDDQNPQNQQFGNVRASNFWHCVMKQL